MRGLLAVEQSVFTGRVYHVAIIGVPVVHQLERVEAILHRSVGLQIDRPVFEGHECHLVKSVVVHANNDVLTGPNEHWLTAEHPDI